MGKRQVAVFLDRDGVVNRAVVRDGKPYPPATLQDLEILPDATKCLPLLAQAGFRLIVVTNQPDVARGAQSKAEVERIHAAIQRQLPIDSFYVCYHDNADRCACRKPAPGLITQAALDQDIDLSQSFLIGDRWRDVEAGFAAGVTTVWLDYGYSERGPEHPPAATVHSVCEAVQWILNTRSKTD